jgi:hypothetical protein
VKKAQPRKRPASRFTMFKDGSSVFTADLNAALASAPTSELVAEMAKRFPDQTPGTMERVFLAKARAVADDSSEFVIAILTNEKSTAAANRVAESVASENSATILACHDGEMFYRVVRARTK